MESLIKIKLTDIHADDDFNCRGKISPIDVIDLWKSIDEKGLLQPIVLRKYKDPVQSKDGTLKTHQLICGFRRYWAHIVGKQETILSRIIECDDEDAGILNLTENLQRRELNMQQESIAVKKLCDKGWTQEKIARQLKVSRTWVINRLKLLSLPDDIQKEAAAGLLNQAHICALFEMSDLTKQYEAVKKIKEAAEKGERVKANALLERNVIPPDVAPKKSRSKAEMFDMIETIMTKLGQCLATRVLAWASGEISEDDLNTDINQEAGGKK